MKIKAIQMINTLNILQKVTGQDLDGVVSWKINKNMKEVTDLFKEMEKKRISLIEKHAKLNEETNNYDYNSDKDREEFSKKYTKELNKEVPVEVKLLDFDDLRQLEITPAEIGLIEWMITED